MNSDQFDPKNTLSFELIQDVFTTPSKETFDTYTKDSPDELKPKIDLSLFFCSLCAISKLL